MYDDYDIEHTFGNENIIDEDMFYEMWHGVHNLVEDADEEYERDTQDYDALAYKHYAWYNVAHTATIPMQAHTLAQKKMVRVTLDITCYDDLDLEGFDWNETLGLEGDECVDVDITDHSEIF